VEDADLKATIIDVLSGGLMVWTSSWV